MAFEATKRELGELYTFFCLLADGKVSLGTPQVRKDETKCWPVALIQREEHDGTRRYYIEQGNVRIVSGVIEKEGTFVAADKEEQVIPREDFGGAAEFILELLKTGGISGCGQYLRLGSEDGRPYGFLSSFLASRGSADGIQCPLSAQFNESVA